MRRIRDVLPHHTPHISLRQGGRGRREGQCPGHLELIRFPGPNHGIPREFILSHGVRVFYLGVTETESEGPHGRVCVGVFLQHDALTAMPLSTKVKCFPKCKPLCMIYRTCHSKWVGCGEVPSEKRQRVSARKWGSAPSRRFPDECRRSLADASPST